MMRRLAATALLVIAFLAPGSQAQARDVFYLVTVDGRMLDENFPGARDRDGFVFLDLVRGVRAFDGLISFKDDTLHVTIGAHSIVYHVGSANAEDGDAKAIVLPAAPFYDNGSIFVPIESFADTAGATVTVVKAKHRVDFVRHNPGPLVPMATPVPAPAPNPGATTAPTPAST